MLNPKEVSTSLPEERKTVLISVPNTGWIHKHCTFALLRLVQDTRYRCNIILPTNVPFENNLHHIVNDFIKGGYDYWLSFDSDNPPLRNPLDLIELDKDIIGCPTPVVLMHKDHIGDPPVYWNAYEHVARNDEYKPWPEAEGLQKVDAIGTGCFLMSKRVFENPEMRKAPFQRQWNEDGTVHKGNDISFSERATKNGFDIWAHFDYRCMHFNELEVAETVKFFQAFADGGGAYGVKKN